MSLKDKVVATILRYNMFGPGSRIGVAVSGGADSVCLLHVLSEIAPQWNLKLGVIHLNHHLRFEESDADEQFVRDLSSRLGLECRTGHANVAESGENLEQAGRVARRAFFAEVLSSGEYDRVATAHTASDQAETVLFRFVRGAYTAGLAGIRPVLPDGIVRPLLGTTRAEVLQYLQENKLPWREDASNSNKAFARNRIRHELLPSLAAEWNPQLPVLLARHAELAREDEEFWAGEVERLLPGRVALGAGEAILDLGAAAGLPPAALRRVVRRAICHVRGDLRQIDFTHIDAILALSAPAGHARLQVPGVDVLRSFHLIRFATPGGAPRAAYSAPLNVPGIALVAQGKVLRAELLAGAHDTLAEGLDWTRVRDLGAPLTVRNWLPGDHYRRKNHTHEEKLKELFNEFRVPLWERQRWPLVECAGRILWARLFGPASDFAATALSETVLQLNEGEA